MNELEQVKKEKEGLDSKLIGIESASKDLDTLLGSQRTDKNKEGLGYSVVPPPAQVYSPPKKDMSWTGLPEFADDTITGYSRPSPSIESNTSDLQNSNSFVSKHGESSSSIMSKPMIKFVKAAHSPTVIKINKVETARKSSVKYAKMYRNTSKSHKVMDNQRNWNNLKSQHLGKDFLMQNKACFKCGHFDHLAYDCGDSACSRHMTGNISNLSEYEPYDGGYMSFGQGGGKITSKVVVAGTSSTNISSTKDVASQGVKKDVSSLRYIALPNWFLEAHLESSNSDAQDACNADVSESSGISNPTATSKIPVADQMESLTVEFVIPTVSSPVPTACLDTSPETTSGSRLISKKVISQEETPSLDNALTLSNQFEDTIGVEGDLSNMKSSIPASPTPTFKIHKDHLKSQIIGLVDTPVQIRHKSKEMDKHSFIAIIHQKTTPDLLQFCLLSCFLSHEEPKKIVDALKDPRIRPIGTKWVLKNKKDERGIVIRNKAKLVAQGHTHEEGIDYEEVFTPVARIDAIRLFLSYASFMGFTVYQMDVKSTFLYGTIDEEVYVMQPPGFQDLEFLDRVYKVEKAMGTIDQTLFIRKHRGDFLLVQVPDIMFVVCASARHQVTPKECHLHAVKRNFIYLKGHPKLGLWYPKESLFDLVAYSDSDYGEYVAAASGCGQVLWIQNQLLDYGDCFEKKLISVNHIPTDDNAADLLTKPFDVERFQYLVFWSTAMIETTNEGTKILTTVDGKPRTIFESSIRRNLKLNDEEGISSLPDTELFENLALMGNNILPNQIFTFQKGQFFHQWKFLIHTIMQCLSPKSTCFNEFSSNIATVVVCLATNRVYNFSKMIFDGMVRNVNSKGSKFLMYPRKVFTTLKVNSPSFSGRTVPLFASMLVTQSKGSAIPIEPYHTPSPQAQQSPHHDHSSPSHPTITTESIPTKTPTETHTLRQYSKRATQIAQSKALSPAVGEPASLLRDDSQGEAFLTERIKLPEDKDRGNAEPSRDDAPIKGRSMEIGEEVRVERSTELGSNDTKKW
nr:hypothetical protein [Tanacetum cinerariifolium]